MQNGFDPYDPNFDPSPGDPIVNGDINDIVESVCIITDKVYAHCQQRECFPEVLIDVPDELENFDLVSIRFRPGEIVPNTLVVTPIADRTNFSRVRFSLRIAFVARIRNEDTGNIVTISGFLPDIIKDIILFIPESRDEFDFRIIVETASTALADVVRVDEGLTLPIGVFIIVKVVGRVQLLIPSFGFCPEPPECEEFAPEDVCEDFFDEDFPDFFPAQFETLYPNNNNL